MVVEQLRERLGANAVPIHLAIGAEEEFRGVIDLVLMKSIMWNEEDQGMTYEFGRYSCRYAGSGR